MNCKEIEKLIPSFLDETIDEQNLYTFYEHVKTCKECEEELAIQYLTTEGLSRLEDGAPFYLDKELESKMNKAGRIITFRNYIDSICANIEWILSALIFCIFIFIVFC